jgi:hypothetical protein
MPPRPTYTVQVENAAETRVIRVCRSLLTARAARDHAIENGEKNVVIRATWKEDPFTKVLVT